MPTPKQTLDWSLAPPGWNWAAQDEDGKWFWYSVPPQLGIGGGVWRAPSRAQQYAHQDAPNSTWYESLHKRPGSSES
ncbi:hypothetical protein CR155_03470 [Pollutimonas nitritireducens]|uniref:Uncharacterized protein n=1 Tax=Pollutimonas nitritireducens TaxID=2045209 RepID=A0A2N4UJS5_9BURK|nr:hypothetical protein [Pollutimonas nitritireducens]PLC55276.1 hypothetical protein CR155_03470 [Pollutimonas nitritireducens]